MYFGIDEPSVSKWIGEYVKTGDIIYDIGAHIGYTCLLLAQKLDGSGSVHAFEILPSIAKDYLAKTVEANDFSNIVIHNIGLSATTQTFALPVGGTGMTSIYSEGTESKELETCRTISLDEYVSQMELPFPSFIKIDIEGAEMDCLIGGKRLISASLPRIIIEFHSLNLLKLGYSFLNSLGYRMYLPNGVWLDDTVLSRTRRFHDSILCLPEREKYKYDE
jgi:FkbM family methyltransferase